MIPEREREALMRLTMCAREECRICMYQKRCDFDFQCELATKNMNILADALRADRKTENSSDEPQTVETMSCAECKHRPIGAEICEEPCHYEPKDEPQTDCAWK